MNILKQKHESKLSYYRFNVAVFFYLLTAHVAHAQQSDVFDLGLKPEELSDIKSESEQEAIELSTDELKSAFERQFLYDAKSIGFDKTGQTYMFQGDVVLIGGGGLITADKIQTDYMDKSIEASGHVIFLAGNNIYTGSKIEVDWETGDFTLERAVMVTNDPKKVASILTEVLGVTTEEIEFESAKKIRVKNIAEKKIQLRAEFEQVAESGATPSDDLLDRYALLLEQEKLLDAMTVPSLSKKVEKDRKTFLKRRRFWRQSQLGQKHVMVSSLQKGFYFSLSGRLIERENGNDYSAKNAIWTPCRCDDDESPAWGFQAETIKAQEEGYISFEHPVLFIKGIPVLYIPYLKVPFKSRRQSGFLMPGFQSGNQNNGFVYTQPVYFAFADNYDSTITTDFFQKRGARVGVDFRYKARKHSGFELNLESIRDAVWLQSRVDRDILRSYYLDEAGYCAADDFECQLKVREHLAGPNNTWRGKNDWSGRYFLTPRLAFVTKGSIVSDHRYLEDLYLPEDYVAAFSTRAQSKAFSTAKTKVSYNGSDYFLSLSSLYGDNVLLANQFSGLQIPGALRLITRQYSLFPKSVSWLPQVYGSAQVDGYFFRDDKLALSALETVESDDQDQEKSLGSGQWQRSKFSIVSPLVREGILRMNYFADAEVRRIEHENLQPGISSIHSVNHGFTFNLPIDGIGQLPSFFQSDEDGQKEYLRHLMNWSLTFSSRPYVARQGPYATTVDRKGAPLVYFASDRDFLSPSDTRDVSNEDTMVSHQRITLATRHRWKTFKRTWRTEYADRLNESNQLQGTLHEKAFQELMASRDRRVNKLDDLFTEDDGVLRWHTNRYILEDREGFEPLFFNASMTYDFDLERLRKRQLESNAAIDQAIASASADDVEQLEASKITEKNIAEPWLGPYIDLGLNWGGFKLTSHIDYNVYKKIASSSVFDLRLPSFYSTVWSFRYVDEKTPYLESGSGELRFKQTKTRSASLAASLGAKVSLGITLVQRDPEGDESQYASSLNLAYKDPSDCWGLRFVREKDLNQTEENANYVLQLSVVFLGNQRAGDISAALRREIPRFTLRN